MRMLDEFTKISSRKGHITLTQSRKRLADHFGLCPNYGYAHYFLIFFPYYTAHSPPSIKGWSKVKAGGVCISLIGKNPFFGGVPTIFARWTHFSFKENIVLGWNQSSKLLPQKVVTDMRYFLLLRRCVEWLIRSDRGGATKTKQTRNMFNTVSDVVLSDLRNCFIVWICITVLILFYTFIYITVFILFYEFIYITVFILFYNSIYLTVFILFYHFIYITVFILFYNFIYITVFILFYNFIYLTVFILFYNSIYLTVFIFYRVLYNIHVRVKID